MAILSTDNKNIGVVRKKPKGNPLVGRGISLGYTKSVPMKSGPGGGPHSSTKSGPDSRID